MSLGKRAFVFALILFLAGPVFAAEVIITKIDKNIYSPGANINVSGVIYSGSSTAANFTVNFTVFNSTNSSISTNKTNTSVAGEFSVLLKAPDNDGNYSLNISSGDAIVTIGFDVSRVSSIQVELVSEVVYVPLASNKTVVNISDTDTQINATDARYGNFSYKNQYYYVVVEKDGTTGKYKTVFLDDDNILWFNNSDNPGTQSIYKYLEKGSKLKLGVEQFELLYIDPLGSGIILGSKVSPTFTGGESVKVLALALNSSDAPVGGVALTLEIFDEKGKRTFGPINIGPTGANNGTNVHNRTIGSEGGVYNLVINKMGRISYQVRTFVFTVSLTTEDGTPVYAVKLGAPMNFTASVLNLSTNTPILQNFLMNITILGPGCSPCTDSATLINGTIFESVSAPAEAGTYNIELAVEFRGVVQRRYIKFFVRGFNIFAFPVAKEKGPSEGFAPGQRGAIFVGGTNMTTGELLNLSNLTGVGTPSPNLTLVGIFDSDGVDRLTGYNVVNVTEFFTNSSLAADAPGFIKEDIRDRFGRDGAVILFTAPNETGIYQAKIKAIIRGATEFAVTAISVQDIFAHAFPINPENGGFQPTVSPGGNVSLAIEAYDAATGTALPAQNITRASLIEVFTENGTVVTDRMLSESFGVANISFFGSTQKFAILSFVVNDSTMGFHPVRFRIAANVTRGGVLKTVEALGEGWFEEKLFKIWVYPSSATRGFFGSNSTINLTVDVRDATGQSGQEGLRVTLDRIVHKETRTEFESTEIYGSDGETPADCTTSSATNTTRAGTCDLSFNYPSIWGLWKSGGYEVRVKVTKTYQDGTEVSDYGHGWFEVRNFRFFAFSRSWEAAGGQNVTFELVTEYFDGTGLSASVAMNELVYMGTWENWRPATVINSSLKITNTTDGSAGGMGKPTGRITLPSSAFSEEGQYAVRMTATAAGMAETTMAWFYVRPFVIFVEPLEQNFERSYATSDVVNLSVMGYQSFDWLSGIGATQTLNASWVQRVEKMGLWGIDFKSKDRMISENNMTSRCSGSQCNLSFNLSGFQQGEYMLVIIANDTAGSKAQGWFWFRIEQLRITVPELIEWLRALETHTMSNSTRITIDDACGGSTDTPVEPANVTNCKYKAVKLVEMRNATDWGHSYNYTFFLLDKDNNTVFVNSSGPARGDELWSFTSVNFSGLTPLKVNDFFTDTLGNRWNITGIDNASNTISLDYNGGVIGYDVWSYDAKEKKYRDTYLFDIDTKLSKSGKFLRADDLEDMDWMSVDLDGDGKYGWEEKYFVILADNVEAGKYGLVLVGNTTNMTRAVNSSDPRGIRFNESANPIYLLGLRYQSGAGGGANSYALTFTSNRQGWPGRDLGIFKPGATIRVPVMVKKPTTAARIENATVRINKAVRFGFAGMEEVPVTSGVVNTSKAGIAIVNVNTSNLTNGDYFLKIVVTDPSTGQDVTTSSIWDNPRVSIRSFVVRGELGLKGEISSIKKWSADAGNLMVNRSDDALVGFTDFMDCDWPGNAGGCGPPDDVFRMGYPPYDRILYYNVTYPSVPPAPEPVLIDADMDGNLSNARPYDPRTELIPIPKPNGNTEFMNVTFTIEFDGYTTTIPNGGFKSDRFYNFTVLGTNYTTDPKNATMRIEKIDPWGSFELASGTFDLNKTITSTGGKPLGFNITGITANSVTIKWIYPTITLNSTLNIEGRNKVARVLNISKVLGLLDDYEAVVYNSPQRQTAEDLDPKNEWKDTPDTVRIIYGNNGTLKAEYAVGQAMSEAGGWAVVKAHRWDERVYLSNLTGSGIVYPVPWVADDFNVFYFGNFTEQSAGIKISEARAEGTGVALSNRSYYMLLFDSEFNGVGRISHAMVDDDRNFDDRWIQQGGYWKPYDYDHYEDGYPEAWDPSRNFSERWFKIGRENWPFTITEFNRTRVTLFSFKDFVSAKNENLSLWVSARNFDGTPINGNITVIKIVGMEFGPMGPMPVEVNISGIKPANLTNGTGYLLMNLPDTIKGGDYTARFRIVAADGRREILEKHFWVEMGAELKVFPPPPLGGM